MQESVTTITPEQSKDGMRRTIISQCFVSPFTYVLSSGGLITLYSQRFGASDLMVGVTNGSIAAGFAAILLVPGLIDRYNKRAVLFWSGIVYAFAASPLMALPQIAAATSNLAAVILMAVILVIYSCLMNIFGVAFTAIAYDFVPLPETAGFFSRMRLARTSVDLVLYVLCAVFLGRSAPLSRFQIILCVLWPGVFVSVYHVTKLPQRPIRHCGADGIIGRVRLMVTDRDFRRYLLFTSAWMVTGCFVPSMMLCMRGDGYSPRGVMIAVAASMVAAAAGYPFWGRLAAGHGPGRAYRLGFEMLAASFLLWLPASLAIRKAGLISVGYGILMVAWALYGAANAGIGIGQTQHSYRLLSSEKASTYLTLQSVIWGAIVTPGMVFVGWIFSLARASEARGWVNPYVVGFAICAVFAMALYPLSRYVPKRDGP